MIIDGLSYLTTRCNIRPLIHSDYEEFLNGYLRCKESQNRFDDGKIDVSDLSFAWFSDLLDRREKEATDDYCYMFHVFHCKTGEALGYCNIRTILRDDIQCAEIGYTVFNNYWGKGFGTEIVNALTEIGFRQLGFHRLEAFVNLDNCASKRVLTKCGYRFECIREKYMFEDGVWTDNEIYYILNSTHR